MLGNRPPELELAGGICEHRASRRSVGIRSVDASVQGTSARLIGVIRARERRGAFPSAIGCPECRASAFATRNRAFTGQCGYDTQAASERGVHSTTHECGPFGRRCIRLRAYQLISWPGQSFDSLDKSLGA